MAPIRVRWLARIIGNGVQTCNDLLLRPVLKTSKAEVPLRLPGLEASRRPDDTGLFREARARTIAEFERRYLTTLLRRVGGNMSRASREAGKERSSLIRLVRKHGLKRDDFA